MSVQLDDARDGLLAEFLIRLRRLERSPKTIKYYTFTIRRFLAYYRRLTVLELTGEHIERYLYHRPLSARSMSTELAVLRTFLRFVIRFQHLMIPNPCDDVEKPRWYERPRPSLTMSEFHALLSVCETHEERLMVSLPYACGLRVSELRGIRWGDVDTGRRRITVIGKGNKERTVPYPAHVTPWLPTLGAPTDYLLASRYGPHKPMRLDRMEKTLQTIARRAGMRYKPTMHVLRYGFARLGRQAGLSLQEVSFIMGHRDVRTTANVYDRLHVEDVQPHYIERVEKLLDKYPSS